MTRRFSTIGLIGKYGDSHVADTLQRLIRHLNKRDLKVVLDADVADLVAAEGTQSMERAELAGASDLVIVVGGDGTMLNAGRSVADAGVPLLGVNLGRLGFLADVSPDKMTSELDQILDGDYREEERTLLHASVLRGKELLYASDALNDVVVHKRDIARMIELEVRIDGHLLNTQRSDGLIVATPTGSSAYALSGGGPLLIPSLNACVLVPICPHSLNNRPFVISDESSVDVVVRDTGQDQAQLTCDGQVNFGLMNADRVSIRRKSRRLRLIHPSKYDYFQILRAKMHWGVHPAN
jgi:NAD+ kinase